MILALNQMSAGAEAVFYLIAVILFVIAAFVGRLFRGRTEAAVTTVDLTALGLAFVVFVFLWNAVART